MSAIPGKKHVGIFATHPIQYHAPWFRALNRYDICAWTVYYGCLPTREQQGVGFGMSFEWDVPLLDGYDWKRLGSSCGAARGIGGFTDVRLSRTTSFIRNEQIDAAIVTGWNSISLVQILVSCRTLGVPVIVRGEANDLRPRSTVKFWLHRALLSRYERFLAIGQLNHRFYRDRGISEQDIFSCPYCVDNAYFLERHEKCLPERMESRRNWGVSDRATCFLFAGKLQPKKRIMDLLFALKGLDSQCKVHALVVGEGELLTQAKDYVHENSLPVTFAGFLNQSEMPTAYAAADCLVLPSDHGETWGLVVNEAMASGLPAIVSDQVGCGPDLVTDGTTGRTFPCGDVDALADCLREAAANPASWKAMGKVAQARVLKDYSLERAAQGAVWAVEACLES